MARGLGTPGLMNSRGAANEKHAPQNLTSFFGVLLLVAFLAGANPPEPNFPVLCDSYPTPTPAWLLLLYLSPQQSPPPHLTFLHLPRSWPVRLLGFAHPHFVPTVLTRRTWTFISIYMSAASDSDRAQLAFQIVPPSGTSLSSELSSWLACC